MNPRTNDKPCSQVSCLSESFAYAEHAEVESHLDHNQTCLFHMLLCKRSGNKLSHSWLSAQKPALVARLKPCPFTSVAHPKPYATPSTIESPAAVGMIRESFHPDASNNLRNSGSVRSRPLGKISICKSRNFPGEKSLPG